MYVSLFLIFVFVGSILRKKALQFHSDLGLTCKFVASKGWLQKFQARHEIRRGTVQGERLPSDSAAAVEYLPEFQTIIDNLHLENLYNADETGNF